MITWDSVDLPDPFGPITACTSPLRTARSTPRMISCPGMAARRPRTTSSLMPRLLRSVCRTCGERDMFCPQNARREASWQLHDHVVAFAADLVDRHGFGGGQRLGLAGEEVKGAAVLPALDLLVLLVQLSLVQRVVLVAACVADGVEVVADA